MTKIRSGSVKSGTARPVDIVDRLLLGRDLLQHYQADVCRRVDGDEAVTDEAEE